MSRPYHGVRSLKPAVALRPRLATVPRRVEGFGGYRDGRWVDTVPAEYTAPESAMVRELVEGGHMNEAAWVHALKAAFEANVVEGLEDDGGQYEQGALL